MVARSLTHDVNVLKGPQSTAELKRRVAAAIAGYFADAPKRERRNRWRGGRRR
jgi:hypothetical protein